MPEWEVTVYLISTPGIMIALVWLGYVTLLLAHGTPPRLIDLPADEPPGGWPKLAVIFAARNEADGVEKATRSMLAQDYPALEVVATNDRSTDATGAILDRLAAEDARLRVVYVHELPPGWLGKNHALHQAARATDADWLLFTDADVVLSPGVLRQAVADAVRIGAGHTVVIPEVPAESFGEKLFMSQFVMLFALFSPPWAVLNPRRTSHLGIGAFNLVRADALKKLGGFERLRLSVDDDMQLGRALKYAGNRPQVLRGEGAVSVRWQVGFWGMVRGLEKNFFAGAKYGVALAVIAGLALLGIAYAMPAALAAGPWWVRGVCVAGLSALCFVVHRVGRQSRIGWHYGLLLPLSSIALVFTLARSTWFTLRRGGVRWRDHLYPLNELRRHVRERERWLADLRRSARGRR